MKKRSKVAEKIRERLFPGVRVFDSGNGRFSPLPWILRNCLVSGLLKQQWWTVLTYLIMRCGPERIWNIENKEIAYALAYSSPAKIGPMMAALQNLGFIKVKEDAGRQYVVLVDPEYVIDQLVLTGRYPPAHLEALNADREKMSLARYPNPVISHAAGDQSRGDQQ